MIERAVLKPSGDRWDCNAGDGHFFPVSSCCGANENEYAEGFCGQCNEGAGWECCICGESMDNVVYGWAGDEYVTA